MITDETVIEIRQRFRDEEITATTLGKIFNTTRQNINQIIDGMTFAHLEVFPRTLIHPRSGIANQSVVTDEMIETIRLNQIKRHGDPETCGFDCYRNNDFMAEKLGIASTTVASIIRKHELPTFSEQHKIDVDTFFKEKREKFLANPRQSLTEMFLDSLESE